MNLIDNLKIKDLIDLNKERGLPTSGNKAILVNVLKKYEKSEYVKFIQLPKPPQKKRNVLVTKKITSIVEQFEELKLADLRKLNKERGLPVSGNRAILIEFLKKYEEEQYYIKIIAKHENFIRKINNVHNFELTEVKNIAKKIISDNPAHYERPQYAHNFFDMIENINVECFGFNGTDLFASISTYINNHKHRREMYKRLMEEIDEAEGTCTIGHVTRLINSIRGFDNDFSATFTHYSLYEAEKVRVFHCLNKELASLFEDYSIQNFELIVNSGKIEFPSNLQTTLQIFEDYSKKKWSVDQKGKFVLKKLEI